MMTKRFDQAMLSMRLLTNFISTSQVFLHKTKGKLYLVCKKGHALWQRNLATEKK